ncbi:two-component system sensor histidine kinase NtrB [Haloglomus litoreum]|uniref:two-component system sensor histidine kinase NtrB n=1 Tax=Haloglomus litoreum TaxID=3034026 RepID=UPI0023E7DA52|nr:PAS domain-containing protein [Haloglomus sp. DT116]
MSDPSPGSEPTVGSPLLDALGDGLLVLDAESGTVTYANGTAVELLDGDPTGSTLDSRLAQGPGLDVAGDERRRMVWELPTDEPPPPGTPAAGSSLETRYLEATLTRTRDGGDPVVMASLRDVTDRVARERSLEQHERVIETMPDGVFVIDETGRMVGGNEAMAEMIGEDMAGLKGKPFHELASEGILEADVLDTYTEIVADLLAGSDHERAEIEVTPPGETTRIYECHVTLRPPDDGPFTGIVGVARDVTERVESQASLRRENERLEQFASVVSHDLRNPLNIIKGRLQLYEETGRTQKLGHAARAAERMDDIISDLLTLAREGETVGETEPVSLATLAEEAWSVVEAGDATLSVPDDAEFEADPDRLQTVLENLFSNAVEHGTGGGGTESGDAGSAADLTVTVRPLGDPDAPAGFTVEDDGVGIPEDIAGPLFEHGVTNAADGTGFGLSIVHRIVEAHGWTVTAGESEAGGARFEIRF